MNASSRTPHRPRRLPPVLRTRRLTQLGVIETVLATVLTVFELASTPDDAFVGTALLAGATLLLVAGTARIPVAASMLSLLLVLAAFVVNAADGVVPLYSIFFTMLIVEIVAACGQILLGGSLACAHWALSAVDPQAGALSTDVTALTLVGAMLAAAFLIGCFRANHARQQERLRTSLAEQERQQRLELARELHDSVATSLTSVVMQAQALTLLPPGDGATHREGLDNISDSSREALSNLRTMLRLLNENPNRTSFRTRVASPPLEVAIARMRQELEAHSLDLRPTVDLPDDVAAVVNATDVPGIPGTTGTPWIDRDTAVKVLTEMTANAAKHAAPHTTVDLTCTVQDGTFVVTMVNAVPSRPGHTTSPDGDDVVSTEMGVGSMRARATKAGGTLEAGLTVPGDETGSVRTGEGPALGGPESRLWRTTLRLPIVVIKS
ncbi:sensor histidine kinase [Corynebacterium kalidii]|uniref:Histidine kinase n=1 Tax=Corynebacterium kalidii TaxID=2931982 RepID=A0A9X2AY65_9CORY|nr:histidine kinase [Corynebacterium kalidii]